MYNEAWQCAAGEHGAKRCTKGHVAPSRTTSSHSLMCAKITRPPYERTQGENPPVPPQIEVNVRPPPCSMLLKDGVGVGSPPVCGGLLVPTLPIGKACRMFAHACNIPLQHAPNVLHRTRPSFHMPILRKPHTDAVYPIAGPSTGLWHNAAACVAPTTAKEKALKKPTGAALQICDGKTQPN